jgi:hypothetical protein
MLWDCQRPISTPINRYSQLRPTEITDPQIDRTEYQYYIRNCLYAIIHTRPDIAFAISKLSQYMSDPGTHHHSGIIHLQYYLYGTASMRIRYGPTSQSHSTTKSEVVLGFVDADYAADISDRKITLSYVFTLAGGAVS